MSMAKGRQVWRVLYALGLAVLLLGSGRLLARPAGQTHETELIGITLELAELPSVQVYAQALARRATTAEATALAQSQLARNDQQQRSLLASGPLRNAQTVFRTQRVYNGIGLYVSPAQLREIAALPGVRSIHPLPVHTVDTVRAVPFLGAPAVWEQVYPDGLAGESVSIGVIDTGIDYLHKHFGGPGAGYAANDPTTIADRPGGFAFPSARIVGGYDFAGDAYSALPGGNRIPQPDPDPMDCWGHGTHVAGIAAGSGLLWQGVTYNGPYTSGLSFSNFAIGPGIAPRADIYALKVFGCSGASSLVPAALEWSVDPDGDGDFSDRLDVINLSVGSSYGSYNAPSAVAAENAALAGVIVVAAAGNSGDAYYIVNSPGVADRAISVAATSVSGLAAAGDDTQPLADVDRLAGFSARGPRRGDSALKPEIGAPGISIQSAAAGTGAGAATFSGTSMATPFVAGAAALLRQLHPGWTVEEIKALLLNTARYNITVDDRQPPLLYGAARTGAGRMDVAAASRTGILAYNASNPGQVALSFGAPAVQGNLNELKNVRLVNKSAVTRNVYLRYLPVVDMPGVDFRILGGAQARLMPFNSLNVALLFEADADAMANVSDRTVARRGLFPRHWLSEETGFLYVWPEQTAVRAELTGAGMIPPANYGIGGVLEGVLNPATGQLDYTLSLSAGAPVTISNAALHLGPFHSNGPLIQLLDSAGLTGQPPLTQTGSITLSQETVALLAAGGVYLQVGGASYGSGAARGQLTPVDSVIRLPVYVAPRPVSAMRARTSFLSYGPSVSPTQSIELVGQGLLSAPSVEAADFPTDTVSVVAALELMYSSPNEEQSTGLLNHGDIKYVGVGSDMGATGTLTDARLLFGIVTYGEWSSPNEVRFRIHLDVDQDGATDFILRSGHAAEFSSSASRDEFFSILEEARTGARKLAHFRNLVSSAELNTAAFNNSALLLAVDAADIGLTGVRSSFAFSVTTQSEDQDDEVDVIDRSPVLTYSVAGPGIRVNNGLADLPLFYDLPGTTIGVEADRDALSSNPSRGVLLMHLHNGPGERAEVVEVRFGFRIFIPQVSGGTP